MSAMQEKLLELTIEDKVYKLAFNINVVDTIQEEFDIDISSFFKMLSDPKMVFKAFRFQLYAMINEGIDIQNDENGTNEPHLKLRQVGALLTVENIYKIIAQVNDLVSTTLPEADDNNTPSDSFIHSNISKLYGFKARIKRQTRS